MPKDKIVIIVKDGAAVITCGELIWNVSAADAMAKVAELMRGKRRFHPRTSSEGTVYTFI